MLKNSDLSIKEIADTLDFPNISFFGKYCRQPVGKSPMKDWKAAARNWMRNVNDWNGGYQQTMAELPDEGDFLR